MKDTQDIEPHERLFEITAFELYSGIKNMIRDEIRRIVTDLGRRQLAGPVASMVAENIDSADTEKPGLGWTLIFLTLRGMGLSSDQFHFILGHNQTTARIDLPLSIFRTSSEAAVKVIEPGHVADELFARVANSLNFGIAIFDRKGDLLEVSQAILDQVGLKLGQAADFPELLKARFSEDVFSGPFNVAVVQHFENYRLKVESRDGRIFRI